MTSKICLAIKALLPYSIIILWTNAILPSIQIDSTHFKNFYYQQNYYSKHFDFSKFFLFISSYFFGLYYFYIFKDHYRTKNHNLSSPKNLIILFLVSIILFFISGITVLHGKYDYEEFCDESGQAEINLHKSI